MRLIDADAVLNNINERIENMTSVGVVVDAAYLWALIYDEINEAPTIEPRNIIACEKVDELDMLERMYAEPTAIRSKTLMPTKDFKEWAKRIREVNPNAVVIPCDAEVVSADRPTSDDLIIKNGKGIQDGLYNIKDGALFKYKAKGGTVRTYKLVSAEQKGGDAEMRNEDCRPSP